ncbi:MULTISPECIES: hypothetical protein [Dietzia]|uniref:Uncharacterized protein n=1 Tax=Dietzia natronolimnaea TaxID=161920 RepID=A0A2A2WQ95_9ACTN|nr:MULTISPECIES: hypothetical protein [Dietzia]AVZ40491.1 hypothetical protein CT688_14470 [Dietzia sp. JS16-p6b]EYT56700.1 hypothetical protein H483_0117060 [Dietzia sp. UCD-THP]MBB1024131.1 hypothetical protein [Dietzia sp. DQ12-76]MBB1029045.1 hypothetical protein [Dietzia sp. DQ11-38-2]PAY23358.1 hypothetical protein CEY15_08555 [Dietzia natronolimnaea]
MTEVTGVPDPGDPEATDEEAVDEKYVQDAPVAPEAEIVAEGAADVAPDEVEAAAEDDETVRGEFQ